MEEIDSKKSIKELKIVNQESYNSFSINEGTEQLLQLSPEIEQSERVSLSKQRSSQFQAFFNTLKTAIGVGILCLPYAFNQAGYILSSICVILINYLIYYTTNLQLTVAKDKFNLLQKQIDLSLNQQQSKQKKIAHIDVKILFGEELGTNLLGVLKLFILILQIGTCISYVIFFIIFLLTAFGLQNSLKNRFIFQMLSLLIVIPMVIISNYHTFYKWNRIANSLMIITLLSIITYALNYKLPQDISQIAQQNKYNFRNIPDLFGIIVFAYECVGHLIPIKNSMKEPIKFQTVFQFATITVTTIYVIIPVISAYKMGSHLNSIIILGIMNENPIYFIIVGLYAFSIIITMPQQMFPIIILIEMNDCIHHFTKKITRINNKNVPKFILLFIIYFISFYIPSFSAFVNFLGAFAGVGLQFIFPIILYNRYYRNQISKFRFFLNNACSVLCVILSVFSIYSSIKDMVQNF